MSVPYIHSVGFIILREIIWSSISKEINCMILKMFTFPNLLKIIILNCSLLIGMS